MGDGISFWFIEAPTGDLVVIDGEDRMTRVPGDVAQEFLLGRLGELFNERARFVARNPLVLELEKFTGHG